MALRSHPKGTIPRSDSSTESALRSSPSVSNWMKTRRKRRPRPLWPTDETTRVWPAASNELWRAVSFRRSGQTCARTGRRRTASRPCASGCASSSGRSARSRACRSGIGTASAQYGSGCGASTRPTDWSAGRKSPPGRRTDARERASCSGGLDSDGLWPELAGSAHHCPTPRSAAGTLATRFRVLCLSTECSQLAGLPPTLQRCWMPSYRSNYPFHCPGNPSSVPVSESAAEIDLSEPLLRNRCWMEVEVRNRATGTLVAAVAAVATDWTAQTRTTRPPSAGTNLNVWPFQWSCRNSAAGPTACRHAGKSQNDAAAGDGCFCPAVGPAGARRRKRADWGSASSRVRFQRLPRPLPYWGSSWWKPVRCLEIEYLECWA